MNARRVPYRLARLLSIATLGVILARCVSPQRGGAGSASQKRAERTVFTDSALFRRICTQADSGLTLATGRCTPRDQGVRIR
jgi:hypothetical protein